VHRQSKIAIKNIYYMLAYTYRVLEHESYEYVKAENFDNIKNLFSAILARGITLQIKQGLAREYAEKIESRTTLRGKINMPETVQHLVQQSRQISCTYDEFSENHLMNQVLKTAAGLLIRDSEVDREHKDDLKRALFLKSVEPIDLRQIQWSTLVFHRNNSSYRMLMNICQLIIDSMLLSTEEGEKKLASFFLDELTMSKIFEDFLLEYYKKHHKVLKPGSPEVQWNVEGDTTLLPKMRTDITLHDPISRRKLIIDAKYYQEITQKRYGVDKARSSNLYQMFAYVKNEDRDQEGQVEGMLLYAKTDSGIIPDEEYNMGGNWIKVKALDLNQDFEHVSRQLDAIANDWLMNSDHQAPVT